jgi:hypothetical protein
MLTENMESYLHQALNMEEKALIRVVMYVMKECVDSMSF